MTQLKVLSWNIWGGKNITEIIETLKKADADIVGLQEVLENEDGSNNNAQTIAEALGYDWVYETTTLLTPSMSHLLKEHGIEKNMAWGNAILSKCKIINNKSYILSETHKRIAIEATVKVDDKFLHAISTHLMYAHFQPSEIQTIQVKNLLKIIPEERSIVIGDFNATPETDVIKSMEKVMPDSGNDVGHTYTSTSSGEKYKLDYIFKTKDIKIVSSGTIESKASDHLPIYSIIEM